MLSNANCLLDFFLANVDDLQGFVHVEKIRDAIKDTMEKLLTLVVGDIKVQTPDEPCLLPLA